MGTNRVSYLFILKCTIIYLAFEPFYLLLPLRTALSVENSLGNFHQSLQYVYAENTHLLCKGKYHCTAGLLLDRL